MPSKRITPPEHNRIEQVWYKGKTTVAICYPNVYRAGMANLAVHLLYDVLNRDSQIICERVFLEDLDQPQHSIESGRELGSFDVIAVTFQYETDYPFFLRMLMASKIPLRSVDRKGVPYIIAGGPCVLENPIPLTPFIDMFVVGEVEPLLGTFLELIKTPERIESGHTLASGETTGWFISAITEKVHRSFVKDLDTIHYPINQIVPHVNQESEWYPAFGRVFLLETSRGCGHSCAFCLIGHTQKPVRFRSLNRLVELAQEGTKATRTSQVALIGSALSDHPRLADLGWSLINNNLSFSLSSLRFENAKEDIIKALVAANQKTITFAPEAGSFSLRTQINKPITDEQILQACTIALEEGIQKIKLYFILGLPSETIEDVDGVIILVKKLLSLSPKPRLELSINPFIPKPHTPFQMEPMLPLGTYRQRLRLIRKALNRPLHGQISSLDPRWARIQAILSLGSERISDILEQASIFGGDLGAWRRAFKEHKMDFEELVEKPRDLGGTTPWSRIIP